MRNYDNPYITEFSSVITECSEDKNGYYVVLENTYFFPEGGGQNGDSGIIGDLICTGTVLNDGKILHRIAGPLECGRKVLCRIDYDKRFRRMQNHSGEHIVSGLFHSLYGADNVGFHLGEDDVTCDLSLELTDEMIARVEKEANKIVYQNRNVKIFYPSSEELASLEYRSKLDLKEDVRIVDIEGVDLCACCAPHVTRTGEIGIIKILDPMKWKSGTRIHLKCGIDALSDYARRYSQSLRISTLLKTPQEEIAESVQKLFDENAKKDYIIKGFKKEKIDAVIRDMKPMKAHRVIFLEDADMEGLTSLVNAAMELTDGYCIALSPAENGYRFAIKGKNLSAKQCIRGMKLKLDVRGGGTDEYASGKINSARQEIEDFFK